MRDIIRCCCDVLIKLVLSVDEQHRADPAPLPGQYSIQNTIRLVCIIRPGQILQVLRVSRWQTEILYHHEVVLYRLHTQRVCQPVHTLCNAHSQCFANWLDPRILLSFTIILR